jgi:peptidoglycan/LPS O-acetylase OafA/YrhL
VIAIALPVCWALALVSWRLVEAPMLQLKSRLPKAGRRRPTRVSSAPTTEAPPSGSAAPVAERT